MNRFQYYVGDETGNTYNLINAIEYAEKCGANICNLSFSDYSYNIALKRTIENSNMLFIVSAGNDGIELDKENAIFPQSYDLDNVISVADMRCDGLLSKTSNFGVETIDIAAPGTDVSGKHMNETVSGTSFASANVTGIAAAIFCMNPTELAPQSLKKILVNSVTKANIEVKSHGYVNLSNAMKAVDYKEAK